METPFSGSGGAASSRRLRKHLVCRGENEIIPRRDTGFVIILLKKGKLCREIQRQANRDESPGSESMDFDSGVTLQYSGMLEYPYGNR